jgi:hypothetical protein
MGSALLGRPATRPAITSALVAGAAALTTAALLAGCASSSAGAPGAPPSTTPGPSGLRGTEAASIQCGSSVFQPDDTRAATLPDKPVRVVICPLPMPNAVSTTADLRPPPADLLRALSLPDELAPAGSQYACAAYADVPRLVYAQVPGGTVYLMHIPVDACGHYLTQALTVVNHYAKDGPLTQ